ncbi:S8 family peptidase [bacterium]|nr:S8 family peptidase [bacterium]
MFNKRFLSLVFCLCYFLYHAISAEVIAAGDYSWVKPGDNVADNYLLVKVAEKQAPLKIEYNEGVPVSGISALDNVTVKFGVFKIEQTHQIMKKNLSNPWASHLTRWYSVYFPKETDIIEIKQALEQVAEIEFVEFRSKQKLRYCPNDEMYYRQWHFAYCGFDKAWEYSKGSESVSIGIVDTGIDMDVEENGERIIHEDLEANLWFNVGEDADNNGVYSPDDWNEQDDDDNGFVDDFFGWDITGDDNWPDDIWGAEDGHGTMVSGIASGVTDNEIGIASTGFSCKLMIAACYDENEPYWLGDAYAGILYCAQMEVDIINISWGYYENFNEHDNEIIQFAHEQGCIIIGAAGNDWEEYNQEDDVSDYPIAYDGVIGVASVTDEDIRAGFSNWGNLVDVVAPGERIYSCRPRNAYTSVSGNSAAAPIVAGLAGLLLSVNPDLNREQVLELMQNTAIDVSEQNADYPGIQYRIDAGALIFSLFPSFSLNSWELSEINGDSDHRFESGEEIAVTITLSNLQGFADASNVRVLLNSEDPAIEFSVNEIEIGELGNGENYEMNLENPFRFNISLSESHYSNLILTVEADQCSTEFELPFIIGQPYFLIVDDDDGENIDSLYHADLDQMSFINEIYCTENEELPGIDYLNEFDAIVWITGNDRNPLSDDEMEIMLNYLESGGYLILIGQYIGDDHADSGFLTNYLHIRHLNDEMPGENNIILGIEHNAISEGLTMLLGGEGGADNNNSPGVCEAINGGVPLFTYSDETTVAGTYFENDVFKTIYIGLALEAVTGQDSSSTRSGFFRNALGHFLSVEPDLSYEIPDVFILNPAYPNPFNSTTTISYSLPQPSNVRLSIYSLSGREIVTLINGKKAAGYYNVVWEASANPAGMYLLRMEAGSFYRTRKIVLVK